MPTLEFEFTQKFRESGLMNLLPERVTRAVLGVGRKATKEAATLIHAAITQDKPHSKNAGSLSLTRAIKCAAERVNDFATPGFMNLLRNVVVRAGGPSPWLVG